MQKIFLNFLICSYVVFANDNILVTISPVEFFVKQIIKDTKEIKVLHPEANFSLKHRKLEIIELSKSSVYFSIGLEKEEEYKSLLLNYNKKLKIFDISTDIKVLKTKNNKRNPYIWMDPLKVRIIAKNILDALVEIDKPNEIFYTTNYNNFLDDVDLLFLEIKQIYYTSSDSVFVFDEYWNYYFNSFGIDFYTLKKQFLNKNEIIGFRNTATLNKTTTILIEEGFDTSMSKSIAMSANNTKIITHNIYAYDWKQNIIKLTNDILGTKDK